jgi:hypothetical protein
MGLGLIVACATSDADRVLDALERSGQPRARQIGSVVRADGGVRYL